MKKIAFLSGINDYAGAANNLRGCVNDVRDWRELLESLGFSCVTLLNEDVERSNFYDEFLFHIKAAQRGDYAFIQYSGHGTQVPDVNGDEPDGYDEALYLRDGVFSDDTTNKILQEINPGANIILAFDSCFSGTGTRRMDLHADARFHPLHGRENYHVRKIKRHGIVRRNSGIEYAYLSGCSESQTSADAYIKGEYHGAFTYFAVKNFKAGLSYRDWHTAYLKDIRRNGFDQIPQLEGCCELFQSPAFGTQSTKTCWFKKLLNIK
jgi:hypothetical protein